MPNILVTGVLTPQAVKILKSSENFKVFYKPGLKGPELFKKLKFVNALIIRTETKITEELLSHAPVLKIICRAGIGLDHIDLNACKARGIKVANTPAGNRISTAEFAIALIFALARKIPFADARMKKGFWEREKFVGAEISGKTLGIVGLGNIGSRVASRAQVLGMKVIACDPFLKPEIFASAGVESVLLTDLFKKSDFVSLHVPLTDETRGLIGLKNLKLMKKTAFLINTSRGAVVEEQALAKAMRTRIISGAAIDVFENEPLPKKNIYKSLPNIILTPHEAGQTAESVANISSEAADVIKNFFL
jgi:D-3-phosphoglycerate dehydrogenase